MESGVKVQTGLRLKPLLIAQLKRRAKAKGVTFNGYVEEVLEKSVTPVFPKIRKEDLGSDDDLSALGKTIAPIPQSVIDSDPRLAYLLSK